ncbi:MAG: cupin domain-containing protein [Rubrobacteraceae bacterium]
MIGLRAVFRKTAGEADRNLLRADWIGSPGWMAGPDHVHPRQDERFEILSGRLGLRVEGVEYVLEEGEALTDPVGFARGPERGRKGILDYVVPRSRGRVCCRA